MKKAAALNVNEAKTHFSKLLARVEKGEDVVIARSGRPIARLVPGGAESRAPIFGSDRGAFAVPEDFDSQLPDELLAEFERRRR